MTACPTGIAHTYMAAEALEAAAERAGVDIHVETQGSAGSTPLARDLISSAAAVIFAVDVGVRDRGRFAGKPVVSSGVKRPMDDGDAMIAEALRYADDPNAPARRGRRRRCGGGGEGHHGAGESWGGRTRRVLMTGVSYMIPFVAAGGLLIALSFLLGGYEIVGPYGDIAVNNTIFDLPDPEALGLDHALFDSGLMAYIGALFFIIGKTAFMLFIPALAGYIAYAIADRPGIAPGFVMGGLAANLFNVQYVRRGRAARHRLPRRHHRRCPRRRDRALDRRLEGADLGARPDAGPGHPAAHLDHRRRADDHRLRQADRRLMEQLTDGLNSMSGSQRDPARRDPRPDDGLRHGRPAQQGRLQLRRGRCRWRAPWPPTHRS